MERINQSINSRQKSGIISEIMFGLVFIVGVYLALLFVEVMFKYINRNKYNTKRPDIMRFIML